MNTNDHFDQQTTPFISSDSYLIDTEVEALTGPEPSSFFQENDTPFLSLYEADESEENFNEEDNEITELISELYDEELNQSLYELANEASEIYESELEHEFNSDAGHHRIRVQQQLVEDYTNVFNKELDYFFQGLVTSTEREDVSQMNDQEIDQWVDRQLAEYETRIEEYTEGESPFEHGFFSRIKKGFKKFKNKIKKVAKKVVRKAARAVKKAAKGIRKGIKKGIKAVKKIGKHVLMRILRRVIKKLKKYILKFLGKVLNSKLVKKYLPQKYHELFNMLRKLMKSKTGKRLSRRAWRKFRNRGRLRRHREVEEFEYFFDEYAYLQHELDVHISNLIHAETEAEEDQFIESYEREDYQPGENELKELDDARNKFVREISQLQEGEDPSPHVENFVMAILQTMRVVLRPIVMAYGRNKTIKNIIAPLIFKILKKFIRGRRKRPILKSISRVLGDIGLKVLLKMEVSEEVQTETAADAIANIAEETLNEIVQLPAYVFEDDELAQAYAMETFEQMASANLPPILPESQYLANPDLRESSVKGSWVVYRSKKRRRKKHCKKYSKVFRKRLSPHLIKEVKTFGETSLAEFLSERMDLPTNQELDANIHLYEAMNESDLYQMSLAEGNVPGLNIESEFGYQLLHPLTPINAGLLLGEPGLGRRTVPIFTASPTFIRPGQRFFYLEIGNARPKIVTDYAGEANLRRLSELNQTFNFIRNQIEINLFISERKAQEIALKLRSGSSYGPALSQLLKEFDRGLKTAMSPIMVHRRTKVVHPYITPGPHSGLEFSKIVPEYVQELFKDQLTLWSARAISHFIKQHAQQFLAAVEDEKDGLSISISLDRPPGFSTIKKMLSNHSTNIPQDFLDGNPENVQVRIKPGFHY